MSDQAERVRFGPYRLVRRVSSSLLGKRWLALRESDQTSHTVYEFGCLPDRVWRRRHTRAMQLLATLQHPHVLSIETCSFEVGGEAWASAPYTGNHDCIVTLMDVVRAKGDMLLAHEAEKAVLQVLGGVAFSHSVGVCNGPVAFEQLLVDRHGSVRIELYGVARALAGLDGMNSELVRDEVRSVVEIAYRLVTGIEADEPRIPVGRLAKKLPRGFEAWIENGLDPTGGYQTAQEAIEALAESRIEPDTSRVRNVLGRLASWSR
jgi:hypothetical protein